MPYMNSWGKVGCINPDCICSSIGYTDIAAWNIRLDDTSSPALSAARRTVINMGYTYHGGILWKSPLGNKPEFLQEGLNAQATGSQQK
jgi:hypothetical protein